MWTYTSKDGTKFAIPYSNIDHVVLSTGEFTEQHTDTSKRRSYYHSRIKTYSKDEVLTILYKKSGGYNTFAGEVAFNQLAITPEHKFVCDKD
jgi:hypothetical protein